MGHATLTMSLLRVICLPCTILGLGTAYLCTKFDHSITSHSRDMVGAHKHFNGLRELTTPLSEIICHPWPRTCYDQPAYQI